MSAPDSRSQPSIVERLRVWPAAYGEDALSSTYAGGIMKQAADRIEELEAALREFVAAYKLQDCDNYTEELARAYSIADAALSSGVARSPT